jgi:hypothetical protein
MSEDGEQPMHDHSGYEFEDPDNQFKLFSVDDALQMIVGNGRFQITLQVCCIVIHILGSQMFFTLPFF